MKEILLCFFIMITFISFLLGCILGGIYNKCHNKSIATRYNLGYIIGCELMRDRY